MGERDDEWDWEWDPEDYDTNQAFYEFSGPDEDEFEQEEDDDEDTCTCENGCGYQCSCVAGCSCQLNGCDHGDEEFTRDSLEFFESNAEPESVETLTEMQVVFSWASKTMLTVPSSQGFNDVRDNLASYIDGNAYDLWIVCTADQNTFNPYISNNVTFEPIETRLRNLFSDVYEVHVRFGSSADLERAYAVAFGSLEQSRDNFRVLRAIAEQYGLRSLTRFVNFDQILVPVLDPVAVWRTEHYLIEETDVNTDPWKSPGSSEDRGYSSEEGFSSSPF